MSSSQQRGRDWLYFGTQSRHISYGVNAVLKKAPSRKAYEIILLIGQYASW